MEGVLPLATTTVDRLDGLGIIVVDDDLNTREMLVAALEHAGADVRAASSAEDALMVLQTWQPRVLVSDIEMAGQDGYELLQRVRTEAGNPHGLVAIALTAHARPEERLRALDAGFQWHLAKPIDPGELVVVIAALSAQTSEIDSPA
jgi:CheY-like chemotaxis protein